MTTIEKSAGASVRHECSPESWRTIVQRLDHLRARKAGNSSTFVNRQYDHALAEFRKACYARNRAQAQLNHEGFRGY